MTEARRSLKDRAGHVATNEAKVDAIHNLLTLRLVVVEILQLFLAAPASATTTVGNVLGSHAMHRHLKLS